MRLGEMLLHDGRITEEQLTAAVAAQARDGGRIGSVLVELGFVDAETVTVYLGLELGLPIATGATLERCKRSAVRLLRPEQAARFRCIPIVIQGQTLIVAMDDPHDMVALDSLAAITGYRIIPRVAPEIRIYYYLERFYGVRRPPRFLKLGHGPRGSKEAKPEHRDLPAPPLPGLPPLRQGAGRTPSAPPVVHSLQPKPPGPAPDRAAAARAGPPPIPAAAAHEAIADAEDLVVELEADAGEEAAPADAVAPVERKTPAAPAAGPAPDPASYPAAGLGDALARIAAAEARGEVANAMVACLAGVFEVGALLLVRDNLAFGWKGFGPGLDPERIETLLVPLEVPSIFQIASREDRVFRGRPFPAALHNHLFKVLRCSPPSESAVVGVFIGHRPVNFLYGHRAAGAEISPATVSDLVRLGEAAAEAYARMITVSKRRRRAAEMV